MKHAMNCSYIFMWTLLVNVQAGLAIVLTWGNPYELVQVPHAVDGDRVISQADCVAK